MFKPRLRRLDQLFTKYPVYFLTTCTDNRRSLLASTKAHDAFVAFALGAPRHHIFVGRYVIMPDHLHLFAAFADQSPSLPQWMKALKRTLAKNLARKYLSGNFWQKSFFDHVLRSEESYGQKWRYVEQNPVRANLVDDTRKWPYQGGIYQLTIKDL